MPEPQLVAEFRIPGLPMCPGLSQASGGLFQVTNKSGCPASLWPLGFVLQPLSWGLR